MSFSHSTENSELPECEHFEPLLLGTICVETQCQLVYAFHMFQSTDFNICLYSGSAFGQAPGTNRRETEQSLLCLLYGCLGYHSYKRGDGVQEDWEKLGPGVREKESWEMDVEWKAMGWVQLLINMTAVLS